MSDVSPLSGISGLSFDSTLLSPLLFFCLVLIQFLSYLFLPAGPFFWTFFFSRKFFNIFHLGDRLFLYGSCLAARRSKLSVVHAACCHMALVFAVRHLYVYFFNCFCPLFKKNNLVLVNRRNGQLYQRVLAFCAFFNRCDTKGTNSLKILCLMFGYVLFYVN